jgi:hypothetical protein
MTQTRGVATEAAVKERLAGILAEIPARKSDPWSR